MSSAEIPSQAKLFKNRHIPQEPSEYYADQGDVAGLVEALPPFKEVATPLSRIMTLRPKVDAAQTAAGMKVRLRFRERHKGWQIGEDRIGLLRRLTSGGFETYTDKLAKEAAKGKNEAAAVGTAKIGEQSIALYSMHWDFFAGSLGVVAGEKLQAASDLAISRNLPLVSIYSSAGVRQQENFAGLIQMTRMVQAIESHKRLTDQPSVAVLNGQVWGGVSASGVPLADLVVAFRGTDYGFSGPRVIETYTKKPVLKGEQSAEINLIQRNVDLLVDDQHDLLKFLHHYLRLTKRDHRVITPEMIANFQVQPGISYKDVQGANTSQFSNVNRQPSEASTLWGKDLPSTQESTEDRLYKQYESLIKNANRPDSEFFMSHSFSDFLPLYNSFQDQGNINYPAIIAGLGKIGEQPFLAIGNQPSYIQVGDKVNKIPSSPGPADFEYMQRMLAMGERLHLPVVFFTDTLGAKPTLEAEKNGQSREIAKSIQAGITYPHPVISVVIGALGSGGGLATTPLGDHVAMTGKSMAFVAEPRSATAILNNEANPTVEDIKLTINNMRATAADQKDLGLIDEVIPEDKNPYITAKAIHDALGYAFLKVKGLSEKSLLKRRRDRIRQLKGFALQ